MASFTVHLILLLILAICAMRTSGVGQTELLSLEIGAEGQADQVFEIADIGTDRKQIDLETHDAAIQSEGQPLELNAPTIDNQTELPVIGPNALAFDQGLTFLGSSVPVEPFRSVGLQSRSVANRAEAALKRGGTDQSEKAVEDALRWLARHQLADGGWSTHFQQAPCNGQCSHSGEHLDPHRAAATGLAILSFLGAGYTHQIGPYRREVREGLYYLIQIQRPSRFGSQFFGPIAKFGMYEQGIAALALCEAYQMTEDPDLRSPCQDALHFIAHAQNNDGSWDYDPRRLPGDLSISCWQIMAFKSGMGSGLDIPYDSLKVFDTYLDSQASGKGAFYGYRGRERSPGTTAMGLLMRMYRGWVRTDPRLIQGVEYLANRGPSEKDVYANYYATQVLFHQGAAPWQRWNPKMRDYLVKTQSQSGHEAGSWFFEGLGFNYIGGRLYCTAMCTMTLEVYYRHMPIYDELQVDAFVP